MFKMVLRVLSTPRCYGVIMLDGCQGVSEGLLRCDEWFLRSDVLLGSALTLQQKFQAALRETEFRGEAP